MSSLFSSPSEQAQAAASATGAIDQNIINQIEGYTTGQQGQLRGAISGVGPNPYFDAAVQMSPSGYAVNPQYTATFGSSGPGTTLGTNNVFLPPASAAPPIAKPVTPPTQAPTPVPITTLPGPRQPVGGAGQPVFGGTGSMPIRFKD